MSANRDAVISLRKRFQDALSTHAFGRSVLWLESVASTNDEARKWADSDAPHGAVVFADHQTGGRGRHGRSWLAMPGLNLTVSLILRPVFQPAGFGLITLAASLAVCECISRSCSSLSPSIKWPNDILIEGKKCCGMLLESVIASDRNGSYVILGIGLNVNQVEYPGSLRASATSLMLACGRPVDRALLLADLLQRLERMYSRVESRPEGIVKDYESNLDGIGRRLHLSDARSGYTYRGIFRGIDGSGALLLDLDSDLDSEIRSFHAGDVRLIENDG